MSVASNPREALRLLEHKAYHLILLEMELGDHTLGLDLCRRLREDEYGIPAVFVTCRNSMVDKVAGLRAGADDYVAKPYDPAELIERIRALTRRYYRGRRSGPLAAGRLKLNVQELMVTNAQGRDVALTPTEMRLFRHLLTNSGQTVSRDSLMNSIWGCDYAGEGNPVDVYVRRLRKKIEREPSRPEIVITVRGGGYKLVP